MPDDSDRFAVDRAQVVHETLDGETVLIHLPSGVYFSLTGWGPVAWSLLVAGHSPAEVGALVAQRAGTDIDVGADVRALVDQLRAESLLITADDARPVEAAPAEWPTVSGDYEPPRLARYDDMQYLLLLDPIHEASDTGWPAQVAPAS
jgi:hypothetical protein